LSLIPRKEHRLRVSENRVLRRIFGLQREEVAGGWRRLHNEEIHYLYASPHIIMVMKSRRMRWKGHVAWTGDMRNVYNILVGKLKETDHSENLSVDRRPLQWLLRKSGGRLWSGCMWFRKGINIGGGGGSC
jgi:hypothetical protein